MTFEHARQQQLHERSLRTGAPFRTTRAPIREPTVVRAETGPPVLVLVRLGRPGEQHEAGAERRHGVREHDLADDAVGFELSVAQRIVPVSVLDSGIVTSFRRRGAQGTAG
ncbi:MAG: hypothetical protein QOG65_2832 [Actinomycetota bacterium]|jgi:hypothetical protein|nr:hypothetical protein [Actinomycetota bacterium]